MEETCSANCGDKMDQFLKRCFYHSGQYSSEEHFAELDKRLKEKEVRALLLIFLSKIIFLLNFSLAVSCQPVVLCLVCHGMNFF